MCAKTADKGVKRTLRTFGWRTIDNCLFLIANPANLLIISTLTMGFRFLSVAQTTHCFFMTADGGAWVKGEQKKKERSLVGIDFCRNCD